ncbi:MAG TPA: tetratricopeptide repeat protein [Gemmatimonadaceae bacterium]|nr:tetratricopeptide repeat protein [Gemmatimonadaceae bacterium]
MRLLLTAALLAFALDAQAQKGQDGEPKRPPMFAGADTNDARGYYELGLQQLAKDPATAARSFYWASRLDPLSADALYARRIALLLSDKQRLMRYWRADRNTMRRADIRAIDSLYLRSLMLNPFFYEKLERVLQTAVIEEIVRQETSGGRGSPAEMEYYIEQYLARAGSGERAFRAYTDGRFRDALSAYATAIKEARVKHYYRNMRGRLFFQMGEVDSALTELSLAVEEVRKRDAKDLVYVYESKALFEHSLGLAYERLGNATAAREAYGRALQEDLAYAPAHLRLGYMAIEQKDTTTAVSEFDLAVQLQPGDAGMRYLYGHLLSEFGKTDEAEVQLKKAVELNPWYALPYFTLGQLYYRTNRAQESVHAYRSFVGLSSRLDSRLSEAKQRIASLSAQ